MQLAILCTILKKEMWVTKGKPIEDREDIDYQYINEVQSLYELFSRLANLSGIEWEFSERL